MKTVKPQTTKQKFWEATCAAKGTLLEKSVFDKAYAKAKRWANNAYGESDMEEYADENGYDISGYYNECESNPAGHNTANQRQYQSNRKDR